ncbi:hypothetical protein [Jeotgalibacillus soli]|uniref:Uncharacterized protein n=1 Tax=Jeotgalibacillus soli TaxID=889306 RepID=A0A0C2VWA0_9BACL|nr:hypothetical protein [Jeotgalibacillus soli]KIL48263.1 hypothetical protein KP78_17100 [Jeotgalibacillus soli]
MNALKEWKNLNHGQGIPIDLEFLERHIAISSLLAELSYQKKEKTIDLVRKWGGKLVYSRPDLFSSKVSYYGNRYWLSHNSQKKKFFMQDLKNLKFNQTEFRIPLDILEQSIAIPPLLAELSYKNQEKTIDLIRTLGENRLSITLIYETLIKEVAMLRAPEGLLLSTV